MEMEGKWWVLYEDEPVNFASSRLYELRGGSVIDGRSGETVGGYEIGEYRTNLALSDRPGDSTIYQLHAGSASADADTCTVDWTTSGFEMYRANWPIPAEETEDEEDDRLDWENEYFGQSVTFGAAVRFGPQAVQ